MERLIVSHEDLLRRNVSPKEYNLLIDAGGVAISLEVAYILNNQGRKSVALIGGLGDLEKELDNQTLFDSIEKFLNIYIIASDQEFSHYDRVLSKISVTNTFKNPAEAIRLLKQSRFK